MTTKKALFWFIFWVGIAAAFNLIIYFFSGYDKAMEFLGGYVIEQSLSLDNLFLFLVIFSSFRIDTHCQRKILSYGIAGAAVLRLIFILLGVAFISRFHWLLYIFGLILLYTGVKIFFEKKESKKDFKDSAFLKFLNRFVRFTDRPAGDRFFVRKNRLLYATPLFAILILIESFDILFAIDSVPAVFSITTDTFIVYTSNIFAILGLRNLYFLLEKMSGAFRFVKQGVAVILVFTGVKLSLLFFHIEIPVVLAVGIIALILAVCILASVVYNKAHAEKSPLKRRRHLIKRT
jgi:integral membrane protein, TerC family